MAWTPKSSGMGVEIIQKSKKLIIPKQIRFKQIKQES